MNLARGAGKAAPTEAGQGLAEYALILGLIAVVVVGALLFLGGAIETTLSFIGNTL